MLSPAQIWRRLGGVGEAPSRLGMHNGSLLVLGGGRNVYADWAKVRPWGGEIMCVNDIGAHVQEIVAHWVTLHPDYLPGWRAYRKGHCYGEGRAVVCHSHVAAAGVDCVWSVDNLGGTSGLFGAFVGLMLGYQQVVLAGVPMDRGGHYFDPPWYETDFGDDPAVRSAWAWARDNIFAGRVRSLSGCTRDWLGAPDGI